MLLPETQVEIHLSVNRRKKNVWSRGVMTRVQMILDFSLNTHYDMDSS